MTKFFLFIYFYAAQMLRSNFQFFAKSALRNRWFFARFNSNLKAASFYKESKAISWQDLEIISISKFRSEFESFNIYGFTAKEANAAANGERVLPNAISAGFSTGTSGGERGIFLSSEKERVQYIATILGKLFPPHELIKIKKIGLCLRSGNSLYNAGLSKRIDFRFFPLVLNKKALASQILDFEPDILIAPTQILIEIAKFSPKGKFKHVFYGAEPMNKSEQEYIENSLGIRIRPIYQATEGFLGIGCEFGNLHLNEDIIGFEYKHLTDKRIIPIITDINRESQKVARLELDDILELSACKCKNPNVVIGNNIVRKQDIWKFDRMYFPDEIENMVSPNIPPIEDYVIFGSASKIEIALENEFLFEDIAKILGRFGVPVVKVEYSPQMNFPKRRHIRWSQ